MEDLFPHIPKCTKCDFHKTCKYTNKMKASGSKNPTWLFVGECPGAQEDQAGKPFVGKAGGVLREALDAIGFSKDKYAMTNACKCWSGKGNPTPTDVNIKACKPYLEKEIEEMKPQVIVMLGAVALKAVTGKVGISKIRGTAWKSGNIYYIPTFHPSSLFYDETKTVPFMQDLQSAFRLPSKGITNKLSKRCIVSSSFDDSMDLLSSIKEDERPICTDFETNILYPWEKGAKIITGALCVNPESAFCIPFFKKDAPYSKEKAQILIEKLKEIVEFRNDNELGFEFYNTPYDIGFGKRAHDIPYPLFVDFDPYSAHHLLNEEMKKPSLSQLTWMYCGEFAGYDEEVKRYIEEHENCNPDSGGSYDNIPLSILGPYNCGDVILPKLLREVFEPKLKREKLLGLYDDIVLPMTRVLADFFINGMAVDEKYLDKLSSEYTIRMNDLIREIREIPDVKRYEKRIVDRKRKEWKKEELEREKSGKRPRKAKNFVHIFNPGSDKQIREVLFEVSKIKPIKFTPKGMPSVDSEVREELMNDHLLVPLVDEYAGFKKWHGTYVKRIKRGILIDNLYHPSYDLTGTVTGRLSGDMQQLPRGTTNKDIKKIFVSRFGKEGILLNQDIAGAELRMFAIVSKDKVLTDIFNNNQDPHIMCATLLYNRDYNEFFDTYKSGVKKLKEGKKLTKEEEEAIKIREDDIKPMVSFGLPYGREAAALAKDTGMSLEEAERFRVKYFKIFSGIAKKIEEITDYVKGYGCVVDITGRVRRLSIATQAGEEYRIQREKAIRQAVNFSIQAPTHSLVMKAMGEMQFWFNNLELKSKLIGEVHDSVIVDAYFPELNTVIKIMKNAFDYLKDHYDWITIPMVTEIKGGPNLLETEEIA